MLETEAGTAIDSALNTLTPEQRELIVRHFFDGESVQDIARSMGLSRQGVYSRQKAIFKRLRETLGDPTGDGVDRQLAMAA